MVSLAPYSMDSLSRARGITHWAALTYANMEEYKEVIQGDRAIKIPVIKVEAEIFKDLGVWLRGEYEPSLK